MNSHSLSQWLSESSPSMPLHQDSDQRKAEVLLALRLLGADEYDLFLPESRCLPRVLEESEVLQGAVYGKYKQNGTRSRSGRGLLVITDQRILLVDKKPLFLHFDDIKFAVVSGITYNKAGVGETVTLRTRLGDLSFRTFNQKCAIKFVRAVEDMLFQTNGSVV